MFRVVTVAREYGSGGAEIGRRTAERLGWRLVDKQLIETIAVANHIDRAWVERADEQCSGWWDRLLGGFRHGGPELFIGEMDDIGVDHDTLQKFTARAIEESAKAGECVIVGRGSQCILQHAADVLHVLVFAPQEEKIERVRRRHPNERDFAALLRRMDQERLHYCQEYYGLDVSDRHLYQLCLNSGLGEDACAEMIAHAARASQQGVPASESGLSKSV
ncbi:MAG: cytidylate kinase-like family protein [Acidobacteriota bacterium]|nr:cytidylate kinase-like family protein [Acidobacteriota bacterium]